MQASNLTPNRYDLVPHSSDTMFKLSVKSDKIEVFR